MLPISVRPSFNFTSIDELSKKLPIVQLTSAIAFIGLLGVAAALSKTTAAGILFTSTAISAPTLPIILAVAAAAAGIFLFASLLFHSSQRIHFETVNARQTLNNYFDRVQAEVARQVRDFCARETAAIERTRTETTASLRAETAAAIDAARQAMQNEVMRAPIPIGATDRAVIINEIFNGMWKDPAQNAFFKIKLSETEELNVPVCYFENWSMYRSQFSADKRKAGEQIVVNFSTYEGCTKEDIILLLNWQMGCRKDVVLENMPKLISLADKLNLIKARDLLNSRLYGLLEPMGPIPPEIALKLLKDLTPEATTPEISAVFTEFLARNFQAVKEHDQFMELPLLHIYHILSSDNLQISSEVELIIYLKQRALAAKMAEGGIKDASNPTATELESAWKTIRAPIGHHDETLLSTIRWERIYRDECIVHFSLISTDEDTVRQYVRAAERKHRPRRHL